MDAGRTKVILVGNSTFPDWGSEVKDIPNVKQNMELLKKVFLDPNYFGIPEDPQHFIEIKDEVSQNILLKVKHETKSFLGKDLFDRLIFYYSGHGIPGEDAKLFFASRDTVRTDYEITSVNSHRLFSYLEAFGAKELIVILDCCYAAQSKENLGDADSLISKSLPQEKSDIETENGIYYLFAAGKDNVAKFNPKDYQKPTYFTEALLNTIGRGTEPGQDYITIGEIYLQLCKEIADLKRTEDPGIPDPRPVLQGNVNGFLFCKNIKFRNQEDIDWNELREKPNWEKMRAFNKKYPVTRFDIEKDNLIRRMRKGDDALEKMEKTKDIDLAIEIKKDYKDILYIWDKANIFINGFAANPRQDDINIESATFNSTSLFNDISNASVIDATSGALVKDSEAKPIDTASFGTKYSAIART